ncbi:MAG: hypothetical protein M4D80_25225 [Myxococcota bacterium]|nr:hypothetical protein [Myxococcota bacterium]
MVWEELSVERAVSDDELAAAVGGALGVDRERITVVAFQQPAPTTGIVVETRPLPGNFALRIYLHREGLPSSINRDDFFSALARLLATRLLVDDRQGNCYTAMLVTPDESVRVNIDDDFVITGLHDHVYSDEIPDHLRLLERRTRGIELSDELDVIEDQMPAPRDPDAFMAAYTPEVQDAQHTLTELLRELVVRKATPDDERALRRTCATLRRAFPLPEAAGMFMSDILRCADAVLAEPWDPDAPA